MDHMGKMTDMMKKGEKEMKKMSSASGKPKAQKKGKK